MSKTNDPSRPATVEDHHTLADCELDAVSGGTVSGLTPLMADKIGDVLGDLLGAALEWLGRL
jgi:hypothetical protein